MIVNHSTFYEDVENLCRDKNLDYIDAVILWCDRNKIEVEYAASLIKKDQAIKEKIQVEAENLNILKRGARLPV
jgi:hypothetical protein